MILLNIMFIIVACHSHEKFTFQKPTGNLFLPHELLLHPSVRIKPTDFEIQNNLIFQRPNLKRFYFIWYKATQTEKLLTDGSPEL